MLSFTKSRFAGKKLACGKYCLTIISLVLVSIQTQAQNGWTHITDMPTPRAAATASVVDGKIYVIGGSVGNLVDVANNEMYDPSTNTWDITLAPMPTPRGFLTSEVVNGIIYVIGGGFPAATNKNEAYNPATDTWTPKADMPGPPRLGMRAGVVNGIIYVIGGNYNQRDCYAYDPSTDTWDTKASMPAGGGALSVTVYNGLIYTFGGSTYSPWAALDLVYAYNPQTNQWNTNLTAMPTPRFAHQTYLVDGKIYAIGGSQGQNTSLATVERYDPVTDTWDTLSNMPFSISWFAGAVVDTLIYVIGGTTNWTNNPGEVWLYNPGVPVELTSFTATATGKEITLNWSTATEINNQGFEIQRRIVGNDFFTVGFVNGHGTTTEPQNYSYADRNLDNGKYSYRLKQVDYDGSYEYSDVVEVDFKAFNTYLLEQNYPNPFNPTTTIGFGLQNKSNVRITVFNSIGEEVAVVLNEEKEPGFHQAEFNEINLPSGVYFYQLRAVPSGRQAGAFVETKKMILLR